MSINQYDDFWVAPILLIIIGGTIFVISMLGCGGALKDSSHMIYAFSVLMSIIFLSELILGLVGIFEHGNLPEVLDSHLSKLQDEYTLRGEAKDAWELVQSELSCCGINGASEWEIVFRNGSISSSCCDLLPINEEFCTVERAAKIGCLYRLERILGTKSLLLAWASFGAAVIQAIGIAFSCCLSRAFTEEYEIV